MSDQQEKHFYCRPDKHYWMTDEWVQEDGAESAFAECPVCSKRIPEASYRLANVAKAWASPNRCGPKTPEGKRRSSMNAYKHGMNAKRLYLLAPALAGKYPECQSCEYRDECKSSYTYCPVRVEPMLRIIQAYTEGNVDMMKEVTAISQARVATIFEMMISDIFKRGVQLPKVVKETAEGETVLDWSDNPLLRRIPEYMAALGTLAEQNMMTPAKKQDQVNTEGYLKSQDTKSEDLGEYIEKQREAVKNLQETMREALNMRKADPALTKYDKEKNSGDDR